MNYSQNRPISQKNLIRILTLLVIVLSFTAGYFHSLYQLEIKRYLRLENLYVRLRDSLGREEAQRRIDLSYDLDSVK